MDIGTRVRVLAPKYSECELTGREGVVTELYRDDVTVCFEMKCKDCFMSCGHVVTPLSGWTPKACTVCKGTGIVEEEWGVARTRVATLADLAWEKEIWALR